MTHYQRNVDQIKTTVTPESKRYQPLFSGNKDGSNKLQVTTRNLDRAINFSDYPQPHSFSSLPNIMSGRSGFGGDPVSPSSQTRFY